MAVEQRSASPMIAGSASLRLDTLVGLRWIAVAGQLAAVLGVHLILGFPLPLLACLGLIALSAAINVVSRLRFRATTRLSAWPAFALLAYDVLQLAALLYLTGGLVNPFSVLLLVPLIVSATTLPPRPTVLLGGIIILAATGLAARHLPLPWLPGEVFDLPLVYAAGVWVALVSASVFTGLYAFRVAEEARQLADALNAAERVLAREQHLHALDGLAAAAAHELGTPLATIALVAKELEREVAEGSAQAEDLSLLRSQSERCRDILSRLTSLSVQGDEVLERLPLSQLVEEVIEPYRAFAITFEVVRRRNGEEEPITRRNPAIVHGLSNLVENAVDFARDKVTVSLDWDADRLAIAIGDDGSGFAPAILDRIGEPYVTTRQAGAVVDEAGGLGLGLFIAKTLLERSGATLDFANRAAPGRGALVTVAWPRARLEASAITPPTADV